MWQVPTAVGNDYWREDNAGGWLPVARFNGSQALGQNQTRYLLDASYLRLKSLSFGYTLPVSLTKQWGIQKCRVYFTGENLLTFKHTPEGFDPNWTIHTSIRSRNRWLWDLILYSNLNTKLL